MNGADALVASLVAADVDVVFGLPGVHNLTVWRALAESSVRLVGVRHEQAAAYAADGWARRTGRVGVALTTTGPGAANTIGAVGEAWAARSPVVVVSTDIPTTVRRAGIYRGALHETRDQQALFRPVTKATLRVDEVDCLVATLQAACATALEPPTGPVFVEIPTDLLDAPVRAPVPEPPVARRHPANSRRRVDHAKELLEHARRPLLWAGGGARDASNVVAALAERLSAPLLTTHQGLGVGAGSPMLVGLPPHLPEAGQLWDTADVVVAIGTDFDGMMTQNWRQPPPRRLVVINVDPVDGSKSYDPDVLLVGEAAEIVSMLIDQLPTGDPARGASVAADLAARRDAARARLAKECPEESTFLANVGAALPADAHLVVDMCIPGYWLAALHPVGRVRSLAYPVGWGTLGFAFPAAIGAAFAGPGPTIAVCGDGGFMFACGELATVVQESVALITVVVDDGGYGMLRYDQTAAGESPCGVNLVGPDIEALAKAFGVRATTVTGVDDEFRNALSEFVARGEPAVLVVKAALRPPETTSPRWYRAEPRASMGSNT